MVGAVPQRQWREGDIYHLECWCAINTIGFLWSRLVTAIARSGREAADVEGGFDDENGREADGVGGACHASNASCHFQRYLNYTLQKQS